MHEWTWRDWNDPDGGIIRLWGTVATVILPRALRPRDDWDGVAFLLTDEEVEAWDEEDAMEMRSRGALAQLAIEGGGDFARMRDHRLRPGRGRPALLSEKPGILRRCWRWLAETTRRYFVAGVVFFAPIGITIWAIHTAGLGAAARPLQHRGVVGGRGGGRQAHAGGAETAHGRCSASPRCTTTRSSRTSS